MSAFVHCALTPEWQVDSSLAAQGFGREPVGSDAPHRGAGLSRAGALADYLRKQAEWRERVYEKHFDSRNKDAAQALREAAVLADTLREDEPGLVAAEEAGWFSEDRFVPSGPVGELVRRWGYNTVNPTLERLLYDLECYGRGPAFWQGEARRVQGLAVKAGLRLIPLRPRDTREPQWQSYHLQTTMGVSRTTGSLLDIERYLNALLDAHDKD